MAIGRYAVVSTFRQIPAQNRDRSRGGTETTAAAVVRRLDLGDGGDQTFRVSAFRPN